MKRIAYSFLLVALLSCGSDVPTPKNRITLQFRDSVIKDYYLLSVREHSLAVSSYRGAEETDSSLINAAEIIPFGKIESIYYKGRTNFTDIALPASVLGCAGSAYGASIGGLSILGDGNGPHGWAYTGIGMACGCAVGAVGGYLLSSQERQYNPSLSSDIKKLQSERSFYHTAEPPELQKIK